MMSAGFEGMNVSSRSLARRYERKGADVRPHIDKDPFTSQVPFEQDDYTFVSFLESLPEYLRLDVVGERRDDPDIVVKRGF